MDFLLCRFGCKSDPYLEEAKERGTRREGMLNDLEDYFQLDYEDIIGGDLPTRFKYRKVDGNSYGPK